MPGRQAIPHGGLEFRASPDYQLRRWLRFPFYFESHNPSFRIDIKRVSEAPPNVYWHNDMLYFEIFFADKTLTGREFPIPDLQLGEEDKVVLKEVYTAYPGQTIIRLPTSPSSTSGALMTLRGPTWQTLYSYQVRTEEQLWLGVLGALLAVLTTIGATAPGWLRLFE